MNTQITNYQKTDSEEIIGERIEIEAGHLFVLSFGSAKFSFVTDDEDYEDLFLTVEEQIEDEGNLWMFDGDNHLSYGDLDYSSDIYLDFHTYGKKREFRCVEDSIEGSTLIEIIIYEDAFSDNELLVLISREIEGCEKEITYFKAEKY